MLPRYPRRAARPQASRRAPCLAKPAHMQTHRGAAAGAMASRYLAVLLITFQLSGESRRGKEPETANVITQTDDHAARTLHGGDERVQRNLNQDLADLLPSTDAARHLADRADGCCADSTRTRASREPS